MPRPLPDQRWGVWRAQQLLEPALRAMADRGEFDRGELETLLECLRDAEVNIWTQEQKGS